MILGTWLSFAVLQVLWLGGAARVGQEVWPAG